jgi:TetR/AcrR family transcriptional regulator
MATCRKIVPVERQTLLTPDTSHSYERLHTYADRAMDRTKTKRRKAETPGQQRRGRKTKGGAGVESALEATKILLKTTRPEELTQHQVAVAAGVSDRMIRYYFGDIDGLLTRVVFRLIDELGEQMEAASRDGRPAMERIRDRLRALMEFSIEHPSFFWMLMQRIYNSDHKEAVTKRREFNQESLARLNRVIQAGRDERSIKSDLDARFFYLAVIGICEIFTTGQPILRVLFPDGNPIDLHENYLDFAFDLVRNGIAERGSRPVERSSAASEEDVQRLESLVLENDRLKRLLAEQMLENAALRDLKR